MIKKFAIVMLCVVGATAFIGCSDSKASFSYDQSDYSSTQVRSFSLKANKEVLPALDSVFFTIDLVEARIFNADSLPLGTDVSGLTINLTTDACSTVDLIVPQKDGTTETVNYLKNSTEPINFANGPVKLHVVSYDGLSNRNYEIKVNVHKMKPDSLYWNRIAMRHLPTSLASVARQHSVRLGDKALCLTSDGSDYCIATTADPSGDDWTTSTPGFSFTPIVESLTSCSQNLYILGEDNNLYRSADEGGSWALVDQDWTHIYGSFDDELLGVKRVDEELVIATISADEAEATPEYESIPEDFPVSETGSLATISTRWSPQKQMIMVGGRLSSGELSQTVWGYDGSSWAKISGKFPVKSASIAMITYTVALTDTARWVTKSVPALLALGGMTENGVSPEVYISRDYGVNWKKGDILLQYPDYIAPRADAQPLVFDATMTSRSSGAWHEFAPRALPSWWSLWRPGSRSASATETWDCPYIYLFGGYDNDGTLFDSIWKGVINRLSFKPLE